MNQTISQNRQIRKHLESGKTITSLEATNKYGCTRLAARILDLKKLGLSIQKTMVKRGAKRFAEYQLELKQ